MLLSPKLLKLLSIQFKLATLLKCIPFGWDNSRSIIKLVPLRGKQVYLGYLNLIIDICLSFITFIGYSHFILVHHHEMPKVIPVLIYTSLITLSVGGSLIIYVYQIDFMTLTNKILQSNNKIANELDIKKSLDGTLVITLKLCWAMAIITTIVIYRYLTKEGSEDNLYTFYGGTHLIGKYTFGIISSVLIVNKFAILIPFGIMAFIVLFTLRIQLKLMRIQVQDGSLKPPQAIIMYASIQTFSTMLYNTFGLWILTSTIILASVLLTLSLSTLISFHSRMNSDIFFLLMEVAVVTAFGIHTAFGLIREACNNGAQLLLLLDEKCFHDPIYHRRVKACVPYRVKFGILFKAKAVTVLTIFGLVVQNVISLVLLRN